MSSTVSLQELRQKAADAPQEFRRDVISLLDHPVK